MPKAMILGGRGQSGLAIGSRLAAEGWSVTATASGPRPEGVESRGMAWVEFDRATTELASVVTPGTDVVIDITCFTVEQADELMGLGDRVGSAIVMSTLSVYSDDEGRTLDQAEDEPTFPDWPNPIAEDWITATPGDGGYSFRKAAIEAALRERAPWPATILRPGSIHGPYSHHLREWYFIKRALDGRPHVVLPYLGESIFQPTASANLAELVLAAAASPGTRTLNCGDLDPPTVVQISETIDEIMGTSITRVGVEGPPPAPNVGDHPWMVPRPVVADMTRAREELGYVQATTYADSLPATVTWAVGACADQDWRQVFTTLANYPTDLFDYEAEDVYLAGRAG